MGTANRREAIHWSQYVCGGLWCRPCHHVPAHTCQLSYCPQRAHDKLVNYNYSKIYFFFMHIHVVCWNREHSLRPSFTTSKQILTSIQNSEFSQTSHQDFHSLQHSWKQEVHKHFEELKKVEQVSIIYNYCAIIRFLHDIIITCRYNYYYFP